VVAIVYPLKKLFRKIFYFLEWKRAVDTASGTYHFGLLLGCALDGGFLEGEGRAPRVRAAIETVLARRGTSPIDNAVREAFRRSKGALGSVAQAATRTLTRLRGTAPEAAVDEAARSVESEERAEIAGIESDLARALAAVPPEYGAELCRLLEKELV
jgi:hypothetical protein